MRIKLFLTLLFLGSVHTELICPEDFTMVMGKCLQYLRLQGWHIAVENVCGWWGGSLVNINNAIENRAVANISEDSRIWIGVYCFYNDTSYCYLDNGSGVATYTNFAAGYPKTGFVMGCVYMETDGSQAGKWFTTDCYDFLGGTVCEVPPSEKPPVDWNCKVYDGYCYTKSNYSSTLSGAREFCKNDGGELVSILSKRESRFVEHEMNYPPRKIMIGAKQYLPNGYAWLDGSKWGPFDNRIAADNGTGDCLGFDVANEGLWSKIECESQLYDFMCKKPIPPASQTWAPGGCPTTRIMAPQTITYKASLYESPTFCTFSVGAVGAEQVRLAFTEVSISNKSRLWTSLHFQPEFNYLNTTGDVTCESNDASIWIDSKDPNDTFTVMVMPY